jgi:hypothetical protein
MCVVRLLALLLLVWNLHVILFIGLSWTIILLLVCDSTSESLRYMKKMIVLF